MENLFQFLLICFENDLIFLFFNHRLKGIEGILQRFRITMNFQSEIKGLKKFFIHSIIPSIKKICHKE